MFFCETDISILIHCGLSEKVLLAGVINTDLSYIEFIVLGGGDGTIGLLVPLNNSKNIIAKFVYDKPQVKISLQLLTLICYISFDFSTPLNLMDSKNNSINKIGYINVSFIHV